MTADWGFGFRGLLYGCFVSEYCSYCESYVRGSHMSGYARYRYMPTQRTCIVATSLSSRLIFIGWYSSQHVLQTTKHLHLKILRYLERSADSLNFINDGAASDHCLR